VHLNNLNAPRLEYVKRYRFGALSWNSLGKAVTSFQFKENSHTSTPSFTFKTFTDNLTFCAIEQFNCAISSLAVCYKLLIELQSVCSYSQSVATVSL